VTKGIDFEPIGVIQVLLTEPITDPLKMARVEEAIRQAIPGEVNINTVSIIETFMTLIAAATGGSVQSAAEILDKYRQKREEKLAAEREAPDETGV